VGGGGGGGLQAHLCDLKAAPAAQEEGVCAHTHAIKDDLRMAVGGVIVALRPGGGAPVGLGERGEGGGVIAVPQGCGREGGEGGRPMQPRECEACQ
jgi:hypothetical protein